MRKNKYVRYVMINKNVKVQITYKVLHDGDDDDDDKVRSTNKKWNATNKKVIH